MITWSKGMESSGLWIDPFVESVVFPEQFLSHCSKVLSIGQSCTKSNLNTILAWQFTRYEKKKKKVLKHYCMFGLTTYSKNQRFLPLYRSTYCCSDWKFLAMVYGLNSPPYSRMTWRHPESSDAASAHTLETKHRAWTKTQQRRLTMQLYFI